MKRSLRSWLWSVPLEQEVDDELAFHREMRARAQHATGIDPRVRDTLMNIGRKRDREMRVLHWLEEFRTDVAFAFRQMRRVPGFTAIAVLTLALGIGANTAIFAVADAALIRPLPFADPDRLVMVWEGRVPTDRIPVNPLNFDDWRTRNHSFSALAAVAGSGGTIVGRGGLPEPVSAAAVTTAFFDVLGIAPLAGRTFGSADDRPAADAVVLSEGFWRRQFGADPTLVGRVIRIDERPLTVIGIMPAAVQFDLPATGTPGPIDLWTVFPTPTNRTPGTRYPHYLQVIARLAPGRTIEQARTDLTSIAEALAGEFPATNKGYGVTMTPVRDGLIGPELRRTTLLIAGVLGFVLLMCCANMAHLLLSRLTRRSREVAVRSALGASRVRVVRQLVTEIMVLAATGGALGLWIAAVLLRAGTAILPAGLLPATITPTIDARVLLFCAGASVATAIACGLAPAWQATSRTLISALRREQTGVTQSDLPHRQALIAAQVAAAVVLLCGAGLLVRTAFALATVDAGFGVGNVLTMSLGVPRSPQSPFRSADSWIRYYESVQHEVAGVAGVSEVAWGTAMPLAGGWYDQAFKIADGPPVADADRPIAGYQLVSASYFDALDIPVVRGRGFTDADRGGAVEVCIVDEAFVRRFLSGRDPLGVRLDVQAMAQPPAPAVVRREIVGVVKQVRERADENDPPPHIYVPIAQNAWWVATLVVRPTSGDANALTGAVRAAVARVNSQRAPTLVQTVDDVAWAATARPRFRALLVATCAVVALVLAMVGVFGVLAHGVEQRRCEFGVRIALGAGRRDILRLVLGRIGKTVAIGTAAGLVAAALLGRTILVFLYGVEPHDAMTFGAVPTLVALTAAVAALLPALRASHVDPVAAFRQE